MEKIQDLLNKIKWHPDEDPKEYTIGYLDRIKKSLIIIKYEDIVRIESNFFVISRDMIEVNIPLHRIRKVMKREKTIWERK